MSSVNKEARSENPFDSNYFKGERGSPTYYNGPESYERSLRRRVYREFVGRFAIQALGLTKSSQVLEIGCATGIMVEKISRVSPGIVGIDLSSYALNEGKRKLSRNQLSLVNAHGESLPFPSSHFDALVSFFTFEHIPDTEQLLKECDRVLKPGTKALLLIDTVRGIDDTHQAIHPREWWTEQFRKHNFEEVSIFPTMVSQFISHFPSWQNGLFLSFNPGVWSGFFLLQKSMLES